MQHLLPVDGVKEKTRQIFFADVKRSIIQSKLLSHICINKDEEGLHFLLQG